MLFPSYLCTVTFPSPIQLCSFTLIEKLTLQIIMGKMDNENDPIMMLQTNRKMVLISRVLKDGDTIFILGFRVLLFSSLMKYKTDTVTA